MPPTLEHAWLAVDRRHRTDAVRRAIHALGAQRALVFMNFHQRLKVRRGPCSACGGIPGGVWGLLGLHTRRVTHVLAGAKRTRAGCGHGVISAPPVIRAWECSDLYLHFVCAGHRHWPECGKPSCPVRAHTKEQPVGAVTVGGCCDSALTCCIARPLCA